MPILSIYVEDKQRAIDAIAYAFRYQPTINNITETIPNPETPEQFTNKILQAFITQHVKNYEIKLATDAASNQITQNFTYIIDNAETATPHHYYMICDNSHLAQYDQMAGVLAPGASFTIDLANIGTDMTVTHHGLDIQITEAQKIQLYTLETFGGTGSGTYPTLLYVRCDSHSNIAQATNIDGFDKLNVVCSMDDVLNYLGLQRVV
jgi:hypothetical protein